MYYLKIIFKTIFWAAIIIAAPLILAFFVNLIATNIAGSFGFKGDFKGLSLGSVIFGMIVFRRFLVRWPFNVTFKAKRTINAPPNVIWEQIRPRARRKNFNLLVSSIRELGDDKYRYYHNTVDGANNGEPNYHDRRVVDEQVDSYIEFECLKEENSPDAVKTARGYLIALRNLGEGKTEVVSLETHHRPSLFTLYVMLFIGASKDSLRQLACACEERENISWASAQIARDTLYNSEDLSLKAYIKLNEELLLIAGTSIVTMFTMIKLWNFV